MPKCIVSYLDQDGIRHSVEVPAESLYEAAAKAISVFRKHDINPAGLAKLEIEIVTTVKHELTVKQLKDWLAKPARSPKNVIEKDRLKELLK